MKQLSQLLRGTASEPHSLARRVVIAFVLMAAIISALFSIGIIVVVQVVERQLVTHTLNGDMTLALLSHKAGRELDLLPDSKFYHDDVGLSQRLREAPEWSNRLTSGVHEVNNDGQLLDALVYEEGSDRYLFVRDRTDFQKREQALFIIVVAGFLMSVFAAWLLGRLLAKKIMSPVIELAKQVSAKEYLLQAEPLAPHYANDEVGQLAHAFDGAMVELRQALAREQFFTSDVSHELRTPLTVISTASELLLASPQLSDRQRGQLERVSRAAQEMRELVHTFLQLARNRLERGNAPERSTISQMAAELQQSWQSQAEEKGLELTICVEDAPTERSFSKPLLRSVMSNLLRNAIHYTDTGFVRLVLNGDSFRVEDSGKGIDETQQEAIFKPFVRGEGARGEGLGLGLSLVKRICSHQAWQIQVSNLYPTGSRFTVLLHE